MTTQTMPQAAPIAPRFMDRLADTPLDPAKGRAREYRVVLALTVAVLLPGCALARLFGGERRGLARRSAVADAKAMAGSALAYAYRY